MKPKEISIKFVQSRHVALRNRWAERNSRMDDYEALYLLDMWESAPEPDERRLSVPICFNTVESFRTLLLTRPPVISVPPSAVKRIETEQADSIEKYLYGVWYRARVMDALNLAEWYGSALGEGVLRCIFDGQAVEGDFPLVVQALDPRTVYACPSGRAGVDLEVVHAFKRARREIEAEWGIALQRDGKGENEEAWLDEEVEYISYWRSDVEEVLVAEEPEEEEPEEEGTLARLMGLMKRAVRAGAPGGEGAEKTCECLECGHTLESTEHCADVTCPECGGEMRRVERPGVGRVEREGEGAEEEPRTRKVRRRVVTHCVVVGNEFVKAPVRIPGYSQLPFIRYPGVATPLADENGALSVLFPITAGVREHGAQGLAAAVNELVAMKQRMIEMFANGALITDDPELEIDFSPGAINIVGQGRQWSFLVPPGPHPAIDQQMMLLERLTQDATVTASMQGRYAGQMSGLALSALNNPVLMKIAHRQQVRERAYETLNEIVLALTEEYAPPDGWMVWGADKGGEPMELQLRPSEIGGYYRNRVELSASLPKDDAGEIMSLAQLVGQKLISRETFLDQLQRIKHLSSQSPQDEMKRILRDTLLFEGPTAETLAKVVLAEYSEELAALVAGGGQPPSPPPGPAPAQAGRQAGPGPPMGGPGPGPMGGMGPGMVAPQAVPPMVGAGPGGPAAMMAMMGNPPPGPVGPGEEVT